MFKQSSIAIFIALISLPAAAQQANDARTGRRPGTIAHGLKRNANQIVLMNGPMYHSAPSSYGTMAFRYGCNIVLEARFDPEDLLQLTEKHRITDMHMVPTMFVRLLRLPDEIKIRYDLSSLRFEPENAALIAKWRAYAKNPKPVMIGEIQTDGQFSIVHQSKALPT